MNQTNDDNKEEVVEEVIKQQDPAVFWTIYLI